MVIGTLALLTHLSMVVFQVSRAAAPKGTKSCRTQGESVCPYVCRYIRPPSAASDALASLWEALSILLEALASLSRPSQSLVCLS